MEDIKQTHQIKDFRVRLDETIDLQKLVALELITMHGVSLRLEFSVSDFGIFAAEVKDFGERVTLVVEVP